MSTVTAVTPQACDCCAATHACSLQQSTRGGTAIMMGYGEYVSPSVPPRYYRRKQNSGSSVTNKYLDGCVVVDTVISCTHDGWCQYNSVTGALTTGGTDTCNSSIQSTGCTTPTADCTRTVTATQTTLVSSPNTGACCTAIGGQLKAVSDSYTQTLSDEDTEDDAKARLLATVDWTEYSNADQAIARWEARTTSHFVYQECKYKIVATGLTGGAIYVASVQVFRREYNVGSYALYQGITETVTADNDGNISFVGDVPNLRGYETAVANCRLLLLQ